MNEQSPSAPRKWRQHPLASAMRMFLVLLPLAAVVVFYLLAMDKVTASTAIELAHASFGLPFDWVEMDLSRYQPIRDPTTVDYN